MPSPAIRLQNITKRFGQRLILDKINLDIGSGEVFGIIGPSGVGKTTFLKTMIGFLTPDTGDVFICESKGDGQAQCMNSVFKRQSYIKKLFGFASQQPSFYTQLTVYENLDYFATLFDLPAEIKKHNIDALLNIMELFPARNTRAESLSGGMQRRLDIACALVHDPKVLILDEPTADLDPMLAKQIWVMIKRINRKGTTIIVATHHLADLENVCTRVGILLNGKLAYTGTVADLFLKVAKCQEIHLETYPGNYERLSKAISDEAIVKKENKGYELILHTSKPETVLHKLLHEINNQGETMIDIRITKIGLDDIFLMIAESVKAKK